MPCGINHTKIESHAMWLIFAHTALTFNIKIISS
ncbi:hypothetical protein EDF88_0499 [Buttiauxella sp. BIGb0552]|nr:hypothetical protein EDF88_0499 [Buttiauxella sp. BIGb0552]